MFLFYSSIDFITSLNLKYSVTLKPVNFQIINNNGISKIINSGYDRRIVFINAIEKIRYDTNANNKVFQRFVLYYQNSFEIITVINFSDINIKNIKNIISFISILINE